MPTIEKVFDSPGPQPNGMQATEEGSMDSRPADR